MARQALEGALETWKLGLNPSSFREQSNVVVGDPDWNAGMKLVEFAIDDDCFDDGRNFHFRTTLKLKNPEGDIQHQEGIYVVATNPVVTVFRDQM